MFLAQLVVIVSTTVAAFTTTNNVEPCCINASHRTVKLAESSSLRFTTNSPSSLRLPYNKRVLRSTGKSPLDAETSGDKSSLSRNDNDPVSSQKIKLGTTSFFENCDTYGFKLKPMAIAARDKAASLTDDTLGRFIYKTKACSCIALFMIYRGYRGIFVILPAVFREVYKNMESSMDRPFAVQDDELNNDKSVDTDKIPFITSVTVSILSLVITISYVISGAMKVLTKFIRTVLMTSSVGKSFEAAADEVMINEGRIMNITKVSGLSGDSYVR